MSDSAFAPRRRQDPAEGKKPFRLHENRRIPLEGSPNFRDLGGYAAADGRKLRYGMIYRSGHLSNLTPADRELMLQIGIRCVIDFRSKQEVGRQPNRLPDASAVKYIHLPIVNPTMEPTAAVDRIRKGDISWFDDSFVIQSYIQKIEAFAQVWRAFFDHLFREENRPLVFHCTAGKDRTGVAAALILLSMGVPQETVVADYLLSNTCNGPFIKRIRQELADIGIDPARLIDYIIAPRKAISALIAHLAAAYGSAWEYLVCRAGVDESRLTQFREKMLV